jgi:hypothetical protein
MTTDDNMRLAGDLLATGNGHTALIWRGQRIEAGVWVDVAAPEPGDRVAMGTFGMDDHASSTLKAEPPSHVMLRLTLWGDYCGSGVERSNHRALLEDYPDTFVDVYGDYGSSYLALATDQPIDSDLFEALVRLADDYPLYDDEDHSRLEDEMAMEAWDLYLCYDVPRGLRERGVSDDDLEALDSDALREAFYHFTAEANSGPYLESADSVVFPEMDATLDLLVTWVAESVAAQTTKA